ncbi:MAG: type II toxin-antitoxin system YafQ family toxin [Patescibacteria group bacterium]|jgi:mRNA interferase YafQ
MYSLKYSSRFKKDLKRFRNDRKLLSLLEDFLDLLAEGGKLSEKYCRHELRGEFKGCFECHLRPDVLLIYKIEEKKLLVLLLRIGSHSELF